jgi:hypothetical protein
VVVDSVEVDHNLPQGVLEGQCQGQVISRPRHLPLAASPVQEDLHLKAPPAVAGMADITTNEAVVGPTLDRHGQAHSQTRNGRRPKRRSENKKRNGSVRK